MNKRSFLKKATNSFVGRVLRRLLGEEKGAVMMEYIVVGLLIAAVAVVAISAFGGYASELFGTLGHAMGGRSTAARNSLTNADGQFKAGSGKAKEHSNKMRDAEMEESEYADDKRGE